MELKAGDKVRFLNEKGEGIVTRVLGNNMVNVAIEEGFEIPVLAADLIKIESGGMAGRFFDREVRVDFPLSAAPTQEPAVVPATAPQARAEEEDYDNSITSLYRQSGAGTTEGIYLIYAPHDQKWLMTGNLDIYLVNNSPYDAIFSFLLRDKGQDFAGVNYEVIPPWSKILIETITREDLDGWSDGIVQVLFHSQETLPVLSPLHAAFKVKPVRFYKESSYREFPLAGLSAVVLNLGDTAGQIIIPGTEALVSAVPDPAARQKITAAAPPAYIDSYRTTHGEAEVDLHISALRDNYSEMSNTEILKYQLDHFRRMLDNAITNNYRKVTFIHGIGNGTLKSAIVKTVEEYEDVEFRTASFAKYGNGAVDIIIHRSH
jgi:hypothetical protein